MNVSFLGLCNGIALAAATANPPDMNTVSLMQQVVQMVARVGTTYDSATTSTTAVLNPGGQFFPQQEDALQAALKQNSGMQAYQLGA